MATSEESELVHRPAQEVAKRVLALIAVVDKAQNQSTDELTRWVSKHKIAEYFSPKEADFFKRSAPSQDEVANQSWRAEALVPLVWALGLIDELPPLNIQISWANIPALNLICKDPEAFIKRASLRPKKDLDRAEEDLYHQHWRVRDAQLHRKQMPEELDPGIVYERRYASSWLVGWGDDWDNVATDT